MAGYLVGPAALSGTAGAFEQAAGGVTGVVAGPAVAPDAGIATGVMTAALAILTGAGGLVGEALRSNAGRVSDSEGGYAGLDDAASALFGGAR